MLDYLFVRWLYNDSQEYDWLAIEGEKSMTSRRVVHEYVTWAAIFGMTLIRKPKVARDNVI